MKLRPLPQSKGSTVSIETKEATNIAEDNYCYIKKYKKKQFVSFLLLT